MAANATAAAIDELWHTIPIENSFVRIAVTAETLDLPRLMFRNATKSPTERVWLFGAGMTIGALDLAVRTIDGESRPILVVKLGVVELRPCFCLMALRTRAPGFGIKNHLIRQEGVAMRILVTVLAPHRRATEPAHVIGTDKLVARGAVLLGMLTRERQGRVGMHLDIKRVRYEVGALVATDAVLNGQRTIVKLPAMRVMVARSAIVRTTPRMPLGKRAFAQVTLRAGNFLMGFIECEARVPMVISRHHKTRIIEVLVIQQMATDATRIRRHTVRLCIPDDEPLAVWRVVARGATASLAIAHRAQLLKSTRRPRLMTRPAIRLAMRTFEWQPPVVIGNEPLLERFLRVTRHARHLHLPAVRVAVTRGAIARQT
jgi:hypothetical protein